MSVVYIPCTDFIGRVVLSEDRVTFTSIDPYGHLNTNRYIEMFVNHRATAPEEKNGISTMVLLEEHKLAMVFAELNVKFLSPAKISEKLEVASWVTEIGPNRFRLGGLITNQADRRVRASLQVLLFSVHAQTGKPVTLPDSMPCVDERLRDCPLIDAYLTTVNGLRA